jgi:hypothetical protein
MTKNATNTVSWWWLEDKKQLPFTSVQLYASLYPFLTNGNNSGWTKKGRNGWPFGQ